MSERDQEDRFKVDESNDPDIEEAGFFWTWVISIVGAVAIYLNIDEYVSAFWLQIVISIAGFVILFIVSAIFRKYIAIAGAILVVIAVIAAFIQGIQSA